MTLETVLVAVGPKAERRLDEVAAAVVDVAVPAGATVVLLHVFSESAYEEGVESAGYDPDHPPPPHTVASRLETVSRLSDDLREADVDHRIRGEVGSPGASIVRAVERTGADLAFVSGTRRTPTGKVLFGRTTHYVLMNAACPVTFVREDLGETDGP